MNSYDLSGKRAIVTGGAQGIGRAIVERFLDSGAPVTIWDMDRALGQRTCDELDGRGKVSMVDVDVADWERVGSATARTIAEMGGVDILICNAGIAGANATVADMDPAEWRRVVEIDLNGVFHCCKAVVPHMIEGGYGRIVNTASIAGKEGNPNASHYSAAKAGVIALTKSLGKELAGHDIAVNCITPAAAKTAHLRPDHPGAYRLHALQDPARPLRRPSRRSPRWSAGSPRPRTASPRAASSTSRAAVRPIEARLKPQARAPSDRGRNRRTVVPAPGSLSISR